MTNIRLENITKTFGSFAVITGLDLTIEAGEFFTFVGPSGCGKSTILNLIAGLEPATGGEILFDGRPVSGLTPMERDVAMIFQGYALYPHMTAYENIAFPLRMKKEHAVRIDSEVRRVADMLGLGEYLLRKPKELSGGQRQRVALGRAIVRKPKLFLMDEPLSNLDAKLRLDMRAELKKLHRELGITTVYVTHDQGEAMGLSDRIAVLEKGELQQCDVPREVYRHPANTFVAGFIGNPPMNLLRAAVVRRSPLELDCNGTVIAPPVDAAPSSDEVIVGIRPEDITVARGPDETTFEATVSMIEPAGSTFLVDALWGKTPIRVVAGPSEVIREGSEVRLVLPLERISVFDGATGRVLQR
jgi:multiple sugar transport system ATP-binding protein